MDKKKLLNYLSPVLVLLFVLGIWWLGAKSVNSDLFFPSPKAVFNEFQVRWNSGLQKDILASFSRVSLGVLFACIVATPLGLLASQIKFIRKIFEPIIKFFSFAPVTAFNAILILLLGVGEAPKIGLVFLAIFVAFLPWAIEEFSNVDKDIVLMAKSQGIRGFRFVFKIIFPFTLPEILRNIVIQYGTGWTYVVVAELIACISGLGRVIQIGNTRGNTPAIYVALLCIIIVNWSVFKTCTFLVKKSFTWRYSGKDWTRIFFTKKTFSEPAKVFVQGQKNTLELRDVWIRYDGLTKSLFRRFNYTFENGIYAIVGRSGCGKSSLLRMIDGVEKNAGEKRRGEVWLNGKKMSFGQKIIMVFQTYPCFPWLRMEKNVKFSCKDDNAKKFVDYICYKFGIIDNYDKRIGRFTNEISGGQQQRMGIAQALGYLPNVLLLDEPSSALDEQTTSEVAEILKEYGREHIIIVITHDTHLIKELNATVIDLGDSCTRLFGEPDPKFDYEE